MTEVELPPRLGRIGRLIYRSPLAGFYRRRLYDLGLRRWERIHTERMERFREHQRVEREQEEKAVLERVEYEAGERCWLEDPDAPLPFLGGPLDGDTMDPRNCDCARRCGCNTWPVQWRPDRWQPWPDSSDAERWAGQYVLNLVWLPDDDEQEEE